MAEIGPVGGATATIALVRRSGRRALLDALAGSQVEWREESATLRGAWSSWRQAACGDRAGAFTAYRAALEREAAAADALARLCGRATRQLGAPVSLHAPS